MRVNCTALLARKMIVTRKFGADAWNHLFNSVARGHACLRSPLTTTTQVPVIDFLAFHDELVGKLYDGDPQSYFALGEQSAFWALTDGPYKSFIRTPEVGEVAKALSRIWRAYYSETTSWAEGRVTEDGIEFSVFGLPNWHPYFEYHVVGYMKGALGLVCANPIEATRIRGSKQEYTYLLHVGSGQSAVFSADPPLGAGRGGEPGARPSLSPREVQVLQLVAQGKTNKEIGLVLGISDRTVQIHITHIYHKLGVYSRAGATMWLSEHPHAFDRAVYAGARGVPRSKAV